MTYRGHVENGMIVLDGPERLPEGSEVQVQPIEKPVPPAGDDREIPSLYERLKPLVGCLKGLPSDLAENHDHYLYGVPKRKRE
jgi:hypothetical protein